MPTNELLTYIQARDYLIGGDLRFVRTAPESGGGHSEILYEISPVALDPLSPLRLCDLCPNPTRSRFLYHIQGHERTHSIALTCIEHSPSIWEEWLKVKKSG